MGKDEEQITCPNCFGRDIARYTTTRQYDFPRKSCLVSVEFACFDCGHRIYSGLYSTEEEANQAATELWNNVNPDETEPLNWERIQDLARQLGDTLEETEECINQLLYPDTEDDPGTFFEDLIEKSDFQCLDEISDRCYQMRARAFDLRFKAEDKLSEALKKYKSTLTL